MRKLAIASLVILGCYRQPNVIIVCDGSPCDTQEDLAGQSDAANSLDMLPIQGCANGAVPTSLGPNVTGCARTFTMGQARQLCQNGWMVPLTATGIDLAKCDTDGAWFTGDAPAYWLVNMSQEFCGGASNSKLSSGCGKDGRASIKMCGGFQRVLDTNVSGWDSTNGYLDNTSNNNPNRGVLCVKM